MLKFGKDKLNYFGNYGPSAQHKELKEDTIATAI